MEKIENWVLDYLKNKNEMDAYPVLTENFLEAGFLDSMQIIELIEDAEDEFQIEFSQDDFQDRRFPTAKGLSEIISERVMQ